jgi:hypothetical protein
MLVSYQHSTRKSSIKLACIFATFKYAKVLAMEIKSGVHPQGPDPRDVFKQINPQVFGALHACSHPPSLCPLYPFDRRDLPLVCLHIILRSENAVKTRLGRARINVPVISC